MRIPSLEIAENTLKMKLPGIVPEHIRRIQKSSELWQRGYMTAIEEIKILRKQLENKLDENYFEEVDRLRKELEKRYEVTLNNILGEENDGNKKS